MIRLAVAAPARRLCGIADYARFLARALPPEIEVVELPYPEAGSVTAWRRVAALADSCDVVHAHYEYSLFQPVKPYRNRFATFLRRLGPPAVVTLHDLLPRLAPRWRFERPYRPSSLLRDLAYAPFFSSWERAQYQRAAHWIVHTGAQREAVARLAGERRVTRLLHPVPPIEHRFSVERPTVDFVTPGFVKPHKGYREFLAVLESLPATRWLIAGGPQDALDHGYLNALRREIERRNLTRRIEITGYLERAELEARAAAARLAVFPYRHAAGSGALTWAIALGLPIVAADVEAFRELARAGAGLELLPAGDPGAWSSAIDGLLREADRRAVLAAANRDFAERHTYPALGSRMSALLHRVLTATAAAGAGSG